MVFRQHLYEHDLWLLIPSLICLFTSIFFFARKQSRLSLLLLLIASFGLRIFMAQLNNYLNEWDEQFHALVAKHLMEHPFKPMLYAHPLLQYDYTRWDQNYIWVHKQPMALWLMAISMRISGINIIALRLPMVVMGTLAVYATYRIGRLIINERYAYIAALLMAINGFLLYFTTGCVSTDHVDFSLFAFTTFSFWAWFEYRAGYKKSWLVMIAVFAGFAALSKSLAGMLVFPAWFIALLSNKEDRRIARNYVHFFLALAIAVAVWLPWQLWINYAFPQEAHYESQMVVRHLFESIEREKEPFWFYFTHLHNMYFDYAIYLVPVGFYLLYRRSREKSLVVFLITAVVITYTIFTLAVTKMEAYTIGCMQAIILALSMIVYALIQFISRRSNRPAITGFIILAGLSALYLNVAHNTGVNTYLEKPDYYDGQVRVTAYYKRIAPELKGYVIFNVPYQSVPVPLMFFTDAIAAYTSLPANDELLLLKKQAYHIAVYDSPDLPATLKDDPAIKKLQFQSN